MRLPTVFLTPPSVTTFHSLRVLLASCDLARDGALYRLFGLSFPKSASRLMRRWSPEGQRVGGCSFIP